LNDNSPDDPEEMLAIILRSLLLSKADSNQQEARAIINKLLDPEYPYQIFKRIALLVMYSKPDLYFKDYKDYLIGNISMLLNEPDYEVEVYKAFEVFSEKIDGDSELKTLIMQHIEKGFVYYDETDPKNFKDMWKQKWYSALKNGSQPFNEKYQLYFNMTKLKERAPGAPNITMRHGNGNSPLSQEQIIAMNNCELAEFLREFKSGTDFDSPNTDALADMLTYSVRENPDKFINDMKCFLETDCYYIYHILCGFTEAWRAKTEKLTLWKLLVIFLYDYTSQKKFVSGELSTIKNRYKINQYSVLSEIGQLFYEATKDDEYAVGEEYMGDVNGLIIKLLNFTKSDENDYSIKEYVNYAINSYSGKLIEALVNTTLRISRLKNKENEIKDTKGKWDIVSKVAYQSLLDKQLIEAYALLGYYCPQFGYLDFEWLKQKIDQISRIDTKDEKWQAFMDGYSYSVVYKTIYNEMKPIYLNCIANDFKKYEVRERLVRHIALGYLRGWDDLDIEGSIFKEVLKLGKVEDVRNVVRYFWAERKSLLVDSGDGKETIIFVNRIIRFWDSIYNKYKNTGHTQEGKKILSNLCLLICYFNSIDSSNYEKIASCAIYADADHSTTFMLKYLRDICKADNKSIGYVIKIIERILEVYTPVWEDEEVEEIVKLAIESGEEDKKIAKKIAETYLSRGHDFLRKYI